MHRLPRTYINNIEERNGGRLQVGDVPLVADASSDILSGPIEVARFGLIYAGAQKNLGPSGVTLCRHDPRGSA